MPSEDDVRESGRDVARVIEYPGRGTFFFKVRRISKNQLLKNFLQVFFRTSDLNKLFSFLPGRESGASDSSGRELRLASTGAVAARVRGAVRQTH